jgi:non-homologous end joining protein Ku
MARAIWSGVLTFGLVSVPVELYSATEAHGPVFHQFEKGTADRIRYQRVNERTTDEVEYSDVVKGAETRDTYTDRVNDLIRAKKNNEEFQPADEAPPGTTVMDLTEALRASVDTAKKAPAGKKAGTRRRAA